MVNGCSLTLYLNYHNIAGGRIFLVNEAVAGKASWVTQQIVYWSERLKSNKFWIATGVEHSSYIWWVIHRIEKTFDMQSILN